MEQQQWVIQDRVKVSSTHYGTGLQGRLGTVLRVAPGGLVEVELDSLYQAGIGIVAFKAGDLVKARKKRLVNRQIFATGVSRKASDLPSGVSDLG